MSDNHKILFAEDSIDAQNLIKIYLKNEKLSYDFADNGLIAVEKFQNDNYALVFMDIMMPELNGIDAMQRIRKDSPIVGGTPIVALSATDDLAEQEKLVSLGFNEFLTKPVSKAKILETISKYIG